MASYTHLPVAGPNHIQQSICTECYRTVAYAQQDWALELAEAAHDTTHAIPAGGGLDRLCSGAHTACNLNRIRVESPCD